MTKILTRKQTKIMKDATLTIRDKETLIKKIAQRAQAMNLASNFASFQKTLCLLNESYPLRLVDFLAADDFDFAHDVCGIMSHFNCDTLKLENFFYPRFAE